MPVPKKKHAGGRPTKFKPEYCQDIIEWFSDPENSQPIPLFEDYAHNLGISKVSLYNWGDSNPEFLNALKKAKEIQEAIWMKAALKNEVNVTFAIFMGKNCFQWRDKQDVNLAGALTINLTSFSESDLDETDN